MFSVSSLFSVATYVKNIKLTFTESVFVNLNCTDNYDVDKIGQFLSQSPYKVHVENQC